MHVASRWIRTAEMILWAAGIVLLGIAIGATWHRLRYQSQQRQELFERASTEIGARAEGADADSVSLPAIAPSPGEKKSLRPEIPRRERVRVASDPLAIGRIEIPRLGLSAFIREGTDQGTLARAVGLVPGTAHPGEGGNVVLAGHRDTFFRPLREIRLNDRIRLVGRSGTYEYRVESTRVVESNDTSVLASRGIEELTLVTCYPFRFIGLAPDRFIVVASRVE